MDNDCDGEVDEHVGGTCYGSPTCSGVLDCKAAFDSNGFVCLPGCENISGICISSNPSINGTLCDLPHPCFDGSYCSGIDCNGSISCSRYSYNSSACLGSSSFGCVWDSSLGDDYMRNFTLGVSSSACVQDGGVFACPGDVLPELCGNMVDDDGDLAIDCEDSDCQHDGSWLPSEVDRYSCLGSNITGSVDVSTLSPPLDYYCAVGETDASVGLCCPDGQRLTYDLGYWSCGETRPCYDVSRTEYCNFRYGTDPFSSWLNDGSECLDSSAPSACCSVVQFGDTDYFSDAGNVKVY